MNKEFRSSIQEVLGKSLSGGSKTIEQIADLFKVDYLELYESYKEELGNQGLRKYIAGVLRNMEVPVQQIIAGQGILVGLEWPGVVMVPQEKGSEVAKLLLDCTLAEWDRVLAKKADGIACDQMKLAQEQAACDATHAWCKQFGLSPNATTVREVLTQVGQQDTSRITPLLP